MVGEFAAERAHPGAGSERSITFRSVGSRDQGGASGESDGAGKGGSEGEGSGERLRSRVDTERQGTVPTESVDHGEPGSGTEKRRSLTSTYRGSAALGERSPRLRSPSIKASHGARIVVLRRTVLVTYLRGHLVHNSTGGHTVARLFQEHAYVVTCERSIPFPPLRCDRAGTSTSKQAGCVSRTQAPLYVERGFQEPVKLTPGCTASPE